MAEFIEEEYADSLEVEGDTKSSARVLSAIKKAERSLNSWQALCDTIDVVYSGEDRIDSEWADPDYDLFWASMEIMKPAIYAYPPQPVVSPQFKDRRKLQNTTADLLERSVKSAFIRTGIDDAMICTRDDLIFYNRGQLWVTYETDEKGGGQRICVEHLDRKDFLYPPARKWADVPWVARRAWMTRKEMRARFKKNSGDAYKDATLCAAAKQNDNDGGVDHSRKAAVWEVWHKADDCVYWVSEGVTVMLDEGKPHLKLRGFFPCPKPAFGTLKPRTLVPVPDYIRYKRHFTQINSLTRRIYALLDMIRMKGLIPAGGDIGDAVEQALADDGNAALLIPVPGAALLATGGAASFVQWLPLAEIATAIQGLLEARRELFSDYDRLSGISDIMRGETEADETLGAQRLKSQYGSVRVKEKIDELQRIARDVTQISAEIMAENFSKDTLLEMSQMEIPTKADIEKQLKLVEDGAEKEITSLAENAKKSAEQARAQGQQMDPQQVQQQFQQAQQQIMAKYGPQIQQAQEEVPIEDVMKLLRDDKARCFAFEIATDSTILTDEMQEKASRNEFLTVYSNASQALMLTAQAGEAGAELAGELLKFVLQPYRVGRDLNGVIDRFVEQAPKMATQGQDNSAEKALADANAKIAEAELGKAQAAIKKVDADTQLKTFELQQKQQEAMTSAEQDRERFGLEIEQTKGNLSETNARIEKIGADIQLAFAKLGIDQQREQREDVKTAADISMRQNDQAMQAENAQRDAAFREQEGMRADRQQDFSERSSDRQQSFAERQAEREPME
ncbi:MAG: hypothetical protein NBV76_05295 [Candidatus Ochrobactrum gambitense]|nr:MAG: hypothetical protein NBV76_05295 [Candidatus Ochrobactrum gambitense]WEK17213.1 MAG: hypothetical protein P0Y54_05665 [Candidatus Ochrobactrum gambitense]